ncbi:MAG: hypothetical protein OXM55_06200 [Bdellovibrionales bacterium]|nr:hypothetical protein [Bdellovibrionales bacterium]
MTKKVPFLILFTLGLLSGVLLYWLINISLISRAEQADNTFRIIASPQSKGCQQLTNITDKTNIDIRCRIERKKSHNGVRYKVRSTIRVKTDETGKALISLENTLRQHNRKKKIDPNYITEADYCSTNCIKPVTVEIQDIKTLEQVSQTLKNKIADILEVEDINIEEALDESYELEERKKHLEDKIANCKISKESTITYIRKIKPEEKVECRRDQLANIEDAKARTTFFNETVKPDLWYLATQERPLDKSFFLSPQMQELKRPDFFSYEYWSVRSAIDTIEKYNDLRSFIKQLEGDNKLAALNSISTQLPIYFYTRNDMPSGRQDRIFLESAWNKNFTERPFPTYYSLSQPTQTKQDSRNNSMSAAQFRAIVNSPAFRNLYK